MTHSYVHAMIPGLQWPGGLAGRVSNHRPFTSVWVHLPQVTMLKIFANMTLPVEWDVKLQL